MTGKGELLPSSSHRLQMKINYFKFMKSYKFKFQFCHYFLNYSNHGFFPIDYRRDWLNFFREFLYICLSFLKYFFADLYEENSGFHCFVNIFETGFIGKCEVPFFVDLELLIKKRVLTFLDKTAGFRNISIVYPHKLKMRREIIACINYQ